jgi:hypothetical protein
MSKTTQQTVTLTPDQLNAIIAEAVRQAVGTTAEAKAEAKPEPAKAKAKRRTTSTGRKALYQHAATAEAETPKAGGAAYGVAPSKGTHAADIAKRREDALEAAIPGISKLAEISHLGKQSGQYLKRFADMDRAGVGFWTWIRFPAKNKAEADQACQSILGLSMDEVGTRLRACGYAWSGNAKAWRCKCNGQPARGGRYFKSEHAERVAFADED